MTADIRDTDHVVRYCSRRNLDADGMPNPGAFKLRDRDDGCLSVNWLEFFGEEDVASNIPHVRA